MRKLILIFKLLVLLLACGVLLRVVLSHRPVARTHGPQVVVSGYVPYTLVKQISGGTLPVTMLLPAGAEPHAFEPSPGTLVLMQDADLFIYVSDTLEPWARDVSRVMKDTSRIYALCDSVSPSDEVHIWMNLDNAQAMARAVKELLAQLSPENETLYAKNLSEFLAQTDALKQDFEALKNCSGKEVVHIGHAAFGPLAAPYGLRLTALSGASHEGEHSARKLAELTKQIKQSGVKTVFTEEVLSGRLARAVADETGAQLLPLYTVEHISKTDFTDGVTYAQLMRRNLDNLKRGLQCPL